MRRAPHEGGAGIDLYAVRRPLDVVFDYAAAGRFELFDPLRRDAARFSKLLHGAYEPERRVRRVAVPRGLPVDDVRQSPLLLEAGERFEYLEALAVHAGGYHPAHENERVAAPVEEPRVAGYHRLEVVALHDEKPERAAEGLAHRER